MNLGEALGKIIGHLSRLELQQIKILEKLDERDGSNLLDLPLNQLNKEFKLDFVDEEKREEIPLEKRKPTMVGCDQGDVRTYASFGTPNQPL